MAASLHRIQVEDGELPVTVARGEGRGAALVIVPSAFGVAPDVQAQMQELAQTAGCVVAIDAFFRGDGGVVPYGDMNRVMARLSALDRERTYRDLRAAIAFVRREHARVVLLGVCFGGPFALRAAADGEVDAIVTWHGTRMEHHLARAHEMRCPMRHHFGAADPFTPPSAVDAVRRAFADHPNASIVVHDGVTHGFSHRDAPAYDAAAERAAMAAVRELVARP